MDFKNYFKELKRRNVFKAALAYLVVGWVIIQLASIAFPAFGVPNSFLKGVFIILILGFPLWLIFAWIYELTPEGLKKTRNVEKHESISTDTNSKFNKLIIGALAIAIILLGANLYNDYSTHNTIPNTENKNPKAATSEKKDSLAKNEKSIAVLAFENMSSDEEQEYFSDGISEEILNYLAKIPDLKVISRTSSFAYKGKDKDVKTIAKELGVAYVLEGSVRKSGEEVRITTQLIHAQDRANVWSETYDRQLKDIFKIQDEIASEVTGNLKTTILKEPIKTTDPKAYTLYLQAKHLLGLRTEEATKNALGLLKQAVAIDAAYAPVWDLISASYYRLGNLLSIPQEQAYQLGIEAAKNAIAIDPEYGLGYLQLAIFNRTKYDFKKAKENMEKAAALDPHNPVIVSNTALLTFASLQEIIENIKKSIELDPLYYSNYANLGLHYYCIGENAKALASIEKYQEYQPGAAVAATIKTLIFLAQGKTQQALKEVEKETQPFFKSYGKIEALYQYGKKEEALKMLDDLIKKYPKEAAGFADIYAFMGNREKTFSWLEKAVNAKDPTLPEAVYYPTFKKFHNDPRWQEVLEKMGVPGENGIPGYKKP